MTLKEIVPLIEPLTAVQRILDHFNQQGVVIGGVATSLLGMPRLTADVDAMLLLSLDDLPELIQIANQVGLIPRIGDVEAFAKKSRVLLLQHQVSGINVDISLGLLPFEVEAVERSSLHRAGALFIRLPAPEDLIIFKAVAHRPKDLQDIREIVHRHPNLDSRRIKNWVESFAQALEMPELWDDIAGLFSFKK